MMDKDANDRYLVLARKWLDKTITPAEQEEFATWYNAGQGAPLNIPLSFAESEEAHKTRILYKINRAIRYENKGINKVRQMRWFSLTAACILLLAIPCAYFHIRNKKAKPPVIAHQKRPKKNDVAPGGNKALLTLADGSKIVLNDAKSGLLARQGQTKLNKAKDDQLVYEAPVASDAGSILTYNTITTPKGGQFQVVLSDGSKVWLNASSSITFPTSFTKKERRISITGEVYFEISKNKNLPFKVESGQQTVEVLGTHFNINAYSDEKSIKTTLVEGSVKVFSANKVVILKPEQQSDFLKTGSGEININTVDTDDILAWKNGNFVFEGADIPFIMRQAARWYNVTIKYEGNVSKRHFTGSISRNVNLSELLKMLKYTGVNFEIEDQTIIVRS